MKKLGGNIKGKTTFLFKLGVALIIVSFVKWGLLLLIPFLPYSGRVKVGIMSVVLVLAEITFWAGVLLVGEETYKKYKDYINPKRWFNKRRTKKTPEKKV